MIEFRLRLTVALLALGCIVAVLCVAIPAGFARGLFVGGTAVSMVAALRELVLLQSGAVTAMVGGQAEADTALLLEPLGDVGWVRLDDVDLFGQGNIDHLLVGPAGVIVVETKWTREAWHPNPTASRVYAAVRQVTRAARLIAIWGGAGRAGVPVRAVVVGWSARTVGDGDVMRLLPDVSLVPGSTLPQWVQRVQAFSEGLEREVDPAWREAFLARAREEDARRRSSETSLPSPARVAGETWVGVVAGLAVLAGAGLGASAWPGPWGLLLLIGLPVTAVSVSAMLIRRRLWVVAAVSGIVTTVALSGWLIVTAALR